jgi:hypothetical protein
MPAASSHCHGPGHARRIDDLHEADRATVHFDDQLLAPRRRTQQFRLPTSVVVGIGFDNVRLVVPTAQLFKVVDGGGAKVQHEARIGRA